MVVIQYLVDINTMFMYGFDKALVLFLIVLVLNFQISDTKCTACTLSLKKIFQTFKITFQTIKMLTFGLFLYYERETTDF